MREGVKKMVRKKKQAELLGDSKDSMSAGAGTRLAGHAERAFLVVPEQIGKKTKMGMLQN